MSLINPFADYEITGDWAEHIARGSAGGIDYPVGYGTPIPSPAAGTITNRSWWGSAGHIVTLALDEPVGPLRAIQFFHLSAHVPEGHVTQGQIIGYSGASANGSLHGGDVHVHTNGLTAVGSRLDWIPYAGGNAQAGTTTPSPNQEAPEMRLIQHTDRGIAVVGSGYFKSLTPEEVTQAVRLWGDPVGMNSARDFDLARSVSVNGVQALVTVKGK